MSTSLTDTTAFKKPAGCRRARTAFCPQPGKAFLMSVEKDFQNADPSSIADLTAAILKLDESGSTLILLVRNSVATKPIYSVKDLANLLGKSEDSIYKLSRQMPNPLPLREFTGTKRGKYIAHNEFMEWFDRATRLVGCMHEK